MHWHFCTWALCLLAWTTRALEIQMDETELNRQFCTGMYSRNSWSGAVDPFILIKFFGATEPSKDDSIVSLVMFEWSDRRFIGVPGAERGENLLALCDDSYVKSGACNSTDIGEFILTANATAKSTSLILSKAVVLKSPAPIKYAIKKTGYYCLITEGFTAKNYKAVVAFRNSYGELSATQIPKLPFYGGITIVYTLMAAYWGFLYYQHRHDILAVQNYITAILGFLIVEMLMTWAFYDFLNEHGSTTGSKVFLIIVGILNAARNSFSFFLLLIVCMGYGVVKPTLGRTMIYVRWLGASHFVFGLVYSITNLLTPPENAGLVSLLTGLPLAATMTAFYMWTLNSLTFTLKDLRDRKQFVKEAMYKKLWWAILATVIAIFSFILFNGASVASLTDPNYFPTHWKTRWFIVDGWLNIIYLIDVAWIAYVWRPTANNRRFAMSDEIAQDDDGNFEIGDIGVPGDSDDDDEEERIGSKEPPSDGRKTARAVDGVSGPSSGNRNEPGTHNFPRASLEGETIFAVGDDGDRFSDDELEEDMNLVRAK